MNSIGKVRIEDIIRQRREIEYKELVQQAMDASINKPVAKVNNQMYSTSLGSHFVPSGTGSFFKVDLEDELIAATKQAFKTTQIKRVADIIRGRKSTKELQPFMQKLFKITADI